MEADIDEAIMEVEPEQRSRHPHLSLQRIQHLASHHLEHVGAALRVEIGAQLRSHFCSKMQQHKEHEQGRVSAANLLAARRHFHHFGAD